MTQLEGMDFNLIVVMFLRKLRPDHVPFSPYWFSVV